MTVDTNITEELRTKLLESGATLVGFADMHSAGVENLPYAACVLIPLPVAVVNGISEAPTVEYWNTYNSVNSLLDTIVNAGAAFLHGKGYSAMPVTRENDVWNAGTMCTDYPYKTVATRAGLGWIGKSCLLVTPQYGSAVRIATLFTDASLDCDTPVEKTRCGNCDICRVNCPADAIHGATWVPEMGRELLVDTTKCRETMKKRMKQINGFEATICGKCFAVCPYTKKYLRKNGY